MNQTGLTHSQVVQRQKEFGENVIRGSSNNRLLWAIVDQLKSVFVLLLFFAAALSFIVGNAVEGILIMCILILNMLFGLYQEHKAEEAVAFLQKMTVTLVRVVRDGREAEIPSTQLVPGDIVYLEEGTKVSADMKLVDTKNIEINESVLTGESLPVPKQTPDPIYMGSIVSKGRGYGEVVMIGMSTKFGSIAATLTSVKKVKTPLEKKLAELSSFIGIVGVGVSILVFLLSYLQGNPLHSSFLLAISLAVAVVPEGLPAVMSVILGSGVKAMARQNAIVRRMSAIETMGSVTLIATDKTGTLTQNNMVVKSTYFDGSVHELEAKATSAAFEKMLLVGNVCSTASLVLRHDRKIEDMLGDPTEGALLVLSEQVSRSYEQDRSEWKIVEEAPFDSETKRMSVLAQQGGEKLVLTKGAPESILTTSTSMLMGSKKVPLTEAVKKDIEKTMADWAAMGYRVIGMSYKTHKATNVDLAAAVDDMVFLGLVALYDPPRPESREAIEKARRAGVEVVMITGDNEKTAEAIATQIGLLRPGEDIITGQQLEQYSDQELMKLLPNTRIFARTTPQLKRRIVALYQKLGEIVIVTGDGVNDAIALKQANVGIAMGQDGTDVARETADIILADDNFATIVVALEEGRTIVRNLKNTLVYLLTGNASEGLAIVFGLMFGIRELFLPIQLLYINLVSDGMPALALGFSPRDRQIMHQKPKKSIDVLEPFDKRYIGSIALMNATLVIASYYLFEHLSAGIGRTAAFFILPISQAFMFTTIWIGFRSVFHHLRAFPTMFWVGFLGPIVGQLLIYAVPGVSDLFHVRQTSIEYMALFLLISTSAMIVFSLKQQYFGARHARSI